MDNITKALARDYCDLLDDNWEEGGRFYTRRAAEFVAKQPAIAALPDVLEALRDARNSGLIYWEPQTARGVEQKALMLARIDAALAKAAGTEG